MKLKPLIIAVMLTASASFLVGGVGYGEETYRDKTKNISRNYSDNKWHAEQFALNILTIEELQQVNDSQQGSLTAAFEIIKMFGEDIKFLKAEVEELRKMVEGLKPKHNCSCNICPQILSCYCGCR